MRSHFLAEVFRFLLPRPRCITYCIKILAFVHSFFKKPLQFFPTFHAKRRLRNDVDGFLLQKRRGSNFCSSSKLAKNPHRASLYGRQFPALRGGRRRLNKQKSALFVCFHSNFMDFCYKRAGGVMIRQAACAYFIIDASGHAMTADDDLVPIGYGVDIGAGHSAFLLPGRLRPGRCGSAGQGSQPLRPCANKS